MTCSTTDLHVTHDTLACAACDWSTPIDHSITATLESIGQYHVVDYPITPQGVFRLLERLLTEARQQDGSL